ncbi:MAG: rhodanese-like domain-containing protein, partial [Desulfobulbaceae bacterium]|nr:rhodanese-like domain-containing protein [Desulfobulbaceae bacterium]
QISRITSACGYMIPPATSLISTGGKVTMKIYRSRCRAEKNQTQIYLTVQMFKTIILTIAILLNCTISPSFSLAEPAVPPNRQDEIALIKKYLLSVTDVNNLLQHNSSAILVDIRDEESFMRTRIPGSINIPTSFIKTKKYLTGMKVVLVDEGYRLMELLPEITRLNNNGFDVSILAGGIAAWHQSGGEFAGDRFDLERFHYIPAHYVAGLRLPLLKTWVDISPQQNNDDELNLSEIIHIPVRETRDIQKIVNSVNNNADSFSAVLIFNADGNYESVASLSELSGSTIFYLKDGLAGYKKAINQQQVMLQARSMRLKTVGGCSTCSEAQEKSK